MIYGQFILFRNKIEIVLHTPHSKHGASTPYYSPLYPPLRVWQDVQTKVKQYVLASDLSQFTIDSFLHFLDLLHRLIMVPPHLSVPLTHHTPSAGRPGVLRQPQLCPAPGLAGHSVHGLLRCLPRLQAGRTQGRTLPSFSTTRCPGPPGERELDSLSRQGRLQLPPAGRVLPSGDSQVSHQVSLRFQGDFLKSPK